jgi:DNA-binding MarR family transcriptional regulator
MAKKSVSHIGAEIHQSKPFATTEEELLVSLLRTTDLLEERFDRLVKPFGISMTQYNVLRILRGAGPGGRTCGEIGERLIAREPDVTRLLERLEKAGFLARTRDTSDRRVVVTRITPAGIKLLSDLDKPMRELDGLLKPMGEKKITKTLKLLDELRALVREG